MIIGLFSNRDRGLYRNPDSGCNIFSRSIKMTDIILCLNLFISRCSILEGLFQYFEEIEIEASKLYMVLGISYYIFMLLCLFITLCPLK